jgi:hypothetical protein
MKKGLVLVTLTAMAVASDTNAAGLDATVETSSGEKRQLASLWSKPTVLFYEDRDSNQLNQHVKEALTERAKSSGMAGRVSVIAVANVAAYDWFPARNFVLKAVRDIEAKIRQPVLLDFTGALVGPPWNLPPKSSTVAVINSSGSMVFQVKGKLSSAQLEELFATLQKLLEA